MSALAHAARRQRAAARLSILTNSVLVVLKLIVGVATGSISVLSEAAHSASDLLAAVLAYFAIRVANQPPDVTHPYGHGKAQSLAALVEGLLILAAALWIAVDGVRALIQGTPAFTPWPGIVVMAVSAVVNWMVSRNLYRVARETRSEALEADALHLGTDVISSIGVLLALGAVAVTGLHALDSLAAFVVVVLIVRATMQLVREAAQSLMDARLSDQEMSFIMQAIEQYKPHFVNVHDIRTRRIGSQHHVDFHLVVHRNRRIADVHALCDRIESEIERQLPHTDVLIHPEPCEADCASCVSPV